MGTCLCGRARPGSGQTRYAGPCDTDGSPGQFIAGKIGYISSVAEFTPKSVQTEELRTSLLYELRVLVDDPQDVLRLGQPATVHLTAGTAQ